MILLFAVPTEVQLIKREHFNGWYRFSSYFVAHLVSTIPVQLIMGSFFVLIVYYLSDQPMEFDRLAMFYGVLMVTAFVSESFGLMISSSLSIVVCFLSNFENHIVSF